MCAINSMTLEANLRNLSENIGFYIKEYLANRVDFGMRTFYAEAFTLALLSKLGFLNSELKKQILDAYNSKDRCDPEYHWEFNQYGMMEAGLLSETLTFKHTPCTNWTLLRSNIRIGAVVDVDKGIREARLKIRRMQKSSGLILDDPGVRSFQYHCFSASMLYEIYQKTGDNFFLKAFLRAVAFIRLFILPNGDTIYVGRGQQQSFGYASLIYILTASYALTKDCSLLGDLANVVRFVSMHANSNGSLPLVLGGGEEPLPHSDNPHQDSRYLGWYAYNNYFDYLPLAALFFCKAADILASAPIGNPVFHRQVSYRDSDFVKLVSGETVAVIARPGGYWTNDLPIPYVYKGGRVHTSCYGGEQFEKSIYSIRGIPLPFRGSKISMRWKAKSFFIKNTLIVLSPVGILLRHYDFGERHIKVHNKILSPFCLRDRYLFPNQGPIIHSNHPLKSAGTEYSASGPLTVFEAEQVCSLSLEFPE